jgi:hypothetical protein
LGDRLSAVIRFTVPIWCDVAIVDRNAVPGIDLHRRTIVDLLDPEPDLDATQAIKRLGEVRGQNIEFLIVPAASSEWMQERPEFARHLRQMHRLLIEEPDVCAVYDLIDQDYTFADGLPTPPREMVALVAGAALPGYFYRSGVQSATWIREALARNDIDIRSLGSMLDFGCGCGRVVRQWRDLDGVDVAGSDYNPYLISWCRENLEFATFKVNGLEPPLDFASDTFDVCTSSRSSPISTSLNRRRGWRSFAASYAPVVSCCSQLPARPCCTCSTGARTTGNGFWTASWSSCGESTPGRAPAPSTTPRSTFAAPSSRIGMSSKSFPAAPQRWETRTSSSRASRSHQRAEGEGFEPSRDRSGP